MEIAAMGVDRDLFRTALLAPLLPERRVVYDVLIIDFRFGFNMNRE